MRQVMLELDECQREAVLALIDRVISDYAPVLFDVILGGKVRRFDENAFRCGLKVLRDFGVKLNAPVGWIRSWDAEIAAFESTDDEGGKAD